jgi:hypothetical protein
MSIATEFPGYDLATLPAIPVHWADESWHNDTCPCWATENGLRVFVDFADPADREVSETTRFSVHTADDSMEVVHEGDDWSAVLAFVEAFGTPPALTVVADLHGMETAEELTWLGFAFAHVALFRERERLARINRASREAIMRATGWRGCGGVVTFA